MQLNPTVRDCLIVLTAALVVLIALGILPT